MSDLLRTVPCFTKADSCRKSDDNYAHVIARLNCRFRVIRCRDDLQWIIQNTDGFRGDQPRWVALRYCAEPTIVHRLVLKRCGIVDVAELETVHGMMQRSDTHDL